MINGYPFELYNREKVHPSHTFFINHTHSHIDANKILKYYHHEQLQIDVLSDESFLIYGTGKVNLEQYLYYNES